MAPQVQAEAAAGAIAPRWSFAKRVGFRFTFAYVMAFCLTTQIIGGMLPLPINVNIDPGDWPPLQRAVVWIAQHLFGFGAISVRDTGSGDRTFDLVLQYCVFAIAIAATAIWSALDRRRPDYARLAAWFRVFVRFALASELIIYGTVKAFPLQMPFPSQWRLVEPFGQLSPMGLLWSFIGASPGYETFTGCAELLGGVLLILPRTTMLGAMVALADMTQVFLLNMTYDVPVKRLSLHLMLFALVLLGPDLRRLWRFFFLDRAPGPAKTHDLFRSLRWNRIALLAQAVFGVALVANGVWSGFDGWQATVHRVKSPLYGIWNIKQATLDAKAASGEFPWRRVIFDGPAQMTLQRADDSFLFSSVVIRKDQSITLAGRSPESARGLLHYQRTGQDQLTLTGDLEGQKVEMQLQLMDTSRLRLFRRFHWVQDSPFNR